MRDNYYLLLLKGRKGVSDHIVKIKQLGSQKKNLKDSFICPKASNNILSLFYK